MSEENTWWDKVMALSPGESFINDQGLKYTNFGKNPASTSKNPKKPMNKV